MFFERVEGKGIQFLQAKRLPRDQENKSFDHQASYLGPKSLPSSYPSMSHIYPKAMKNPRFFGIKTLGQVTRTNVTIVVASELGELGCLGYFFSFWGNTMNLLVIFLKIFSVDQVGCASAPLP